MVRLFRGIKAGCDLLSSFYEGLLSNIEAKGASD